MFQTSFILCTRNRLPYLKILFGELLDHLLPNEELVVIDGGSTDGSAEFLDRLYREGRIHQYRSEPDRNQAEAWNKALLLARGTIIKKIMDDDVFCLDGIRTCSHYLLNHPETDLCIANALHVHLLYPDKVSAASRLSFFEEWRSGETGAFTFSDADLLIRRSALPLTGLYDTSMVMIDWEFSLRCSFLQLGIAYYTGYLCLSVFTPGNVSAGATATLKKREQRIGQVKYGYPGDGAGMSRYSKLKIFAWKMTVGRRRQQQPLPPDADELARRYRDWYRLLAEKNAASNTLFIP